MLVPVLPPSGSRRMWIRLTVCLPQGPQTFFSHRPLPPLQSRRRRPPSSLQWTPRDPPGPRWELRVCPNKKRI